MLAADFDDYCAAQRKVDRLWQTPARWNKAAILNIAGMSWFSSDRAISEYATDIWNIPV
jgi:starch phosphorylase